MCTFAYAFAFAFAYPFAFAFAFAFLLSPCLRFASVLLCVIQNGSDHIIYKTSHLKYNEKNKDAGNMGLLDEDDDFMLTVTVPYFTLQKGIER